jgi:transcription initiation factor TFIIB
MGLAASILYIASKETGEIKTQKDMATAAGVTEVTIRNRIRSLGKDLDLLAV